MTTLLRGGNKSSKSCPKYFDWCLPPIPPNSNANENYTSGEIQIYSGNIFYSPVLKIIHEL